jgi:hypothetical protein
MLELYIEVGKTGCRLIQKSFFDINLRDKIEFWMEAAGYLCTCLKSGRGLKSGATKGVMDVKGTQVHDSGWEQQGSKVHKREEKGTVACWAIENLLKPAVLWQKVHFFNSLEVTDSSDCKNGPWIVK